MSGHTRKHPTKTTAFLKKSLVEKINRLNNRVDLINLNQVIDKFIPNQKPLSPEKVFGDDWTDSNKKLGLIIQGLRFREGLTQIQLATKLKDVKQSNISAWENGKESIPSKRVKQLSKIFGTDIQKLL